LATKKAAKCIFVFKHRDNTLFRFMYFSKIKRKDDIINKDVEKDKKIVCITKKGSSATLRTRFIRNYK